MANQGIEISLAGKVALITGAARGLGAEIAATFSRAGAAVMIADILEDQGRQTAAAIGYHELHHELAIASAQRRVPVWLSVARQYAAHQCRSGYVLESAL